MWHKHENKTNKPGLTEHGDKKGTEHTQFSLKIVLIHNLVFVFYLISLANDIDASDFSC